MTLKSLAILVHKFFDKGTIKVSNITLTTQAIEGYLTLAYGFAMDAVIDRKRRMGEMDVSYLISGAIKEQDFDVEKKGNNHAISLAGLKVMRMDNAMQIVGFNYPEDDCGCGRSVPNLESISYVQPYEAKFYQGEGYEGLFFFSLSGDKVILYNLPDCLTKVSLQYVSDSSEVDLPQNVCLQVCKIAFPDIFGVKKLDKSKIDDYSNDAINELKLQLSANATV